MKLSLPNSSGDGEVSKVLGFWNLYSNDTEIQTNDIAFLYEMKTMPQIVKEAKTMETINELE